MMTGWFDTSSSSHPSSSGRGDMSLSTDLHRLWAVSLGLAWAREGASAGERRTKNAILLLFLHLLYIM